MNFIDIPEKILKLIRTSKQSRSWWHPSCSTERLRNFISRSNSGGRMSSKGIYAAVSGALAQSQRLDTIANNLANVNTTGFKKDRQVFNEYLTSYEKQDELIRTPRVPASVESFYDMQGGDKAYVNTSGTYTNFTQGDLKSSGSATDLALEGRGFFEVLTPQGVRYTRNGSLQVDNLGRIVTKDGFPVLRSGNQNPEQRTFQVNSSNLTVSKSGDVFEGANAVGRLSIVDFANPDELGKVGGSYYQLKANATSTPAPALEATVHQGFVEASNVNVVEEMTDMITANRVFEATQAAIKAQDQMDDKLINQVGKV